MLNKLKSINQKKLIIIGLIIIVILIIMIIIKINKKNNLEETKQQLTKEQEIKKNIKIYGDEVKDDIMHLIYDVFNSTETTTEDLKELIGAPLGDTLYIIGDKSYINVSLSKKNIKKYKLEDYVATQQKYANRLEKEYLDNLKIDFGETTNVGEEIHQELKVISFYYGMYINDLMTLQSKVFKLKYNDKVNEINPKTQEEADYYKAKVDAMGILDKHFDNYVNHEEVREVTIAYKDGKPLGNNEVFTILCNITGQTYPNTWLTEPEVLQAQNDRISEYLKELQ